MAYNINRYNGNFLTTVEDGTINTTTEIRLIGRNFAGYGEVQNENVLHLLENFSSPVPPAKPLSGMIWYDNSINKIKFYDGIRWRTAGSAEVNNSEPMGNVEGDLWWNTNTGQLFIKSSEGEWVLIGPQISSLGVTQLFSKTVQGKPVSLLEDGTVDEISNDSFNFSIIRAVLTNESGIQSTPFIIAESNFQLNHETEEIAGFDILRKGITLFETTQSNRDTGISKDSILWGTASNALRLGGKTAEDFITADNPFFEDGITVNETVLITSDNDKGIMQNIEGDTLIFKVLQDVDPQTVLIINLTGLIPGEDNRFDIGTPTDRWKDIYAVNFKGIADKAEQLRVEDTPNSDDFRRGREGPDPNSIAARTSGPITVNNQTIPAGSLRAQFFVGRATTAQFADLAEKYTTNQEWPVGTAMAVCAHEECEVCPANSGDLAVGVISENPAYLMNAEINGQAVALKGRVPVRVTGPVKKGQAVYAWKNGICSTTPAEALIGVALATDNSLDEKLVECVLKV